MPEPTTLAVVTTIQPPTQSMRALAGALTGHNGRLIVVGDKKGPASYELEGVDFWPLERQLTSGFRLASCLPVGHYGRKNVGYLAAISAGAVFIYETDDDNAPLPGWRIRDQFVKAAKALQRCDSDDGRWVNVYRYFTRENIWPRGLPLDEIGSAPALGLEDSEARWAPVQQGLVNGSPDVDAIWRLTQDRPLEFDGCGSVYLGPGNWCPFNTQSTWWWPAAYPLMYVPSHCSFRMCDIWRGFVAQRCLWELGAGLCFHGPEVVQDRNQHNLMRDFEDEIPGYHFNKGFGTLLKRLSLRPGPDEVTTNMRRCYEALVGDGRFPREELALVDAWLGDLAGRWSAVGSDGVDVRLPRTAPLSYDS
ncbi:MAG: hypothetical protein ABSF26_02580 [Thermoguttaceae bacterium]